jgi:hypothetical protein
MSGALLVWLLVVMAGVFALLVRRGRGAEPAPWAERVSVGLLYLALALFLAFVVRLFLAAREL